MRVTNNLFNFKNQNINKKTVSENKFDTKYRNTTTPSFGRLGDSWVKESLLPIEKAAKYLKEAHWHHNYVKKDITSCGYLGDAENLYIKSVNLLTENWIGVGKEGQKNFVDNMFDLADCRAHSAYLKGSLDGQRYRNYEPALNTYKRMLHILEIKKSPLIKDENILNKTITKLNKLGALATKTGKIDDAKSCYEFCLEVAQYSQNIAKKPLNKNEIKMIKELKENIKVFDRILNINTKLFE